MDAAASPPTAVLALSPQWNAVGLALHSTCGIKGDGTLDRKDDVVQVGIATDWTHVTASGSATCGLRGAGDLYCWGSNDYGELGDGTALWTAPALVP